MEAANSTSAGDAAASNGTVGLVFFAIVAVLAWAAALCLGVRKARQNDKECRRLQKRAAWLRELLDLLQRPASSGDEAPATAGAVRTVLVNRLRATVKKVDRVTSSWAAARASCCRLPGHARSEKMAGKLQRANAEVNDVYVNVLPVVSQIDSTHSVVLMLGERRIRPLISQHGLGDGGRANGPSDTQSARSNVSFKVDLEPLVCENDHQTSKGT